MVEFLPSKFKSSEVSENRLEFNPDFKFEVKATDVKPEVKNKEPKKEGFFGLMLEYI